MSLSASTARHWLERWDRQQEGYLPDRETIFAVIADAVEAAVRRPDPVILDLGCGPGSLGARIRERLPRARVIGVDSDPVLLAIASAAYDIELVDHDLADPGWIDALPVSGPFDAVVSTTALHWLTAEALASVYAQVGARLRAGGILLNGDTMAGPDQRITDLRKELVARQIARAGVTEAENWEDWWVAIKEEPELADAIAERDGRTWGHPARSNPGYAAHREALAAAGLGSAGTVWQYGQRRILAAIK
jgi:SAM-dependent methyltransferase